MTILLNFNLTKYEFLEDIFLGCRLHFAIGIVQEFGELEGGTQTSALVRSSKWFSHYIT